MSGTLPQRFQAAFPMATFKKAMWSKHSNLFKHATEVELDQFSTPTGLWCTFCAAVQSRIASQISTAEEKLTNSDLQPNADALDCSFCGDVLPTSLSLELLKLWKALDDAYETKRDKGSLTFISALVEHCARHKAERTFEVLPADCKWLTQVNYASLGRRVEVLHSVLLKVWHNPVNNYFYKAVMLQVDHAGADKAFDCLGDFKASEVTSVG